MQDWIKKYWKYALMALPVVIALIVVFLIFCDNQADEKDVGVLLISSSQTTTKRLSPTKKESKENNQIYVDISGAISHPGVYCLSKNDRLFTLIQKAGGLTENAAVNTVNQSIKLEDQQKIVILTQEEAKNTQAENTSLSVSDSSISKKDNDDQAKININQADLSQLQQLSGIGAKKAQAIIDYRTENGDFKSIDELGKVNGIGEKTVEKLKNSITI